MAGPSEMATSNAAALTAAEGGGATETAQSRPPVGRANRPPVARLASKDASAVLAAAAAEAKTAPQPWRQDMLDAEAGVRGAAALRRGRGCTPNREAVRRSGSRESRSGREQSMERQGRFSTMGSRGGVDQSPGFAIEVHGLGPGAVSVPQRCGSAAGAETDGARRQFTAADFFSAEQLAELEHEDASGSSSFIEQERSEPELAMPRQRTAVPSLRLGSVGGEASSRDPGAQVGGSASGELGGPGARQGATMVLGGQQLKSKVLCEAKRDRAEHFSSIGSHNQRGTQQAEFEQVEQPRPMSRAGTGFSRKKRGSTSKEDPRTGLH